MSRPASLTPGGVREAMAEHGYLADEGLATSVLLSMALRRPLLLEGDPGTGKTEVAKVLAAWTGGRLLRLQCYEGIDAAQALYQWDHARQLLHIRAAEARGQGAEVAETDLYDERFLLRRPILEAVSATPGAPPVLLIDEVDRADDEFEALLLEVLADWSVTIPELGTVVAARPPLVVLTSNRTRELHDALRRRCLYHWVDHPERAREVAIIGLRVPAASASLAEQVAIAVERYRGMGLYKPPGVAESIDWAGALAALGRSTLDEHTASATLGVVLKHREDQERVRAGGLLG